MGQPIQLTFILAQVAGILTMICAILSVQLRDIRKILIGAIISNLLTVANYALLGSFSGAWVCVLATAQTICIYFYTRRGAKFPWRINLLFMLGYTGLAALSFRGAIDLLPWACALLYAMEVAQEDSKHYRRFALLNSALWLVYDLCSQAYTMSLTHTFLVISIITAMIRLDLAPRAPGDGESSK